MSLHLLCSHRARARGAGRGPCPASALGNKRKKESAFTPDYPAIVWASMEHHDLPSDRAALLHQPKMLPKPSNSQQDRCPAGARSTSDGLGAYGGAEMLNTSHLFMTSSAYSNYKQ